jgi:hypothetical protein
MTNPATPVARRAGPRIDKPSSNIRSYSPPATAAQRPLARRRPNAPFADDLIPASGLESLSVGVVGGADLRLLDLIEEVGRHGIK